MANLSNINNKFLVTTGGNVLIGQTAAVGSSILQVTGNSTFAGNVSLPDNAKAIFGTGNDLEVYHDAGNSWIKDTGSGQLRIASSTLRLYDADLSHLQAQFIDGGAAELYYSGNKKLETTNTGISVSDVLNDIFVEVLLSILDATISDSLVPALSQAILPKSASDVRVPCSSSIPIPAFVPIVTTV